MTDVLNINGLWLSILIPVFNTQNYLRQCLDSILEQDPSGAGITGVEILLLDDGSSDGSVDICMEYAQAYPDVVKFVQVEENRGIAAARNHLLDMAECSYIWYIDSDDYILPNSLALIRSAAVKHTPDMIILDYLVNEKTRRKSFPSQGGKLEHGAENCLSGVFKSRKMYCWQKVIRKAVWDNEIRFPEGRVFEDIDVISRLLFQIKTYYYVPIPCLNYRTRDGSIMSLVSRNKGGFEVEKHNELLEALVSLKDYMQRLSMPLKPETNFNISNFIAREYIKTAKRYKASNDDIDVTLAMYESGFQACSPLSFKALSVQYLIKGKWLLFFKLSKARRV